MTTYYADTFTRANSTTVPGTPDTGGPYTVRTGTWGINGNALYTSASTANSAITFPITSADFDATWQIPVQVGSNSVGFLFRWVDASNFWLVFIQSGNLILQRRVAGTATNLMTIGATVVGDTYRVVAKGSRIQVFINGVMHVEVDDPFQSTTAVCGWWMSSSTAGRIDNASIQTVPSDITYGIDSMTAKTPDDSEILAALDFPIPDAFAYLGHGTKSADTGGS